MFYEVDYTFKVEEFGSLDLEADDDDHAESLARQTIAELYPDAMQVVIEEIKEVTVG